MDWSPANAAFVEIVQRFLAERGHYAGRIDRKAGEKTVTAWKRYVEGKRPAIPAPEVAPGAGEGGLVYRSRERWGANASLPRLGRHVDPHQRTQVWIHHTVTVDSDESRSVWETWDEIAAHMRRLQTIRPDLGLDVPYTAVGFVTPVGGLILCEGRGLERVGAHTPDRNTPALGFAFAGDFENHPPAGEILDRAVRSLGLFLRNLREGGGFSRLGEVRPGPERAVFGHRDLKELLGETKKGTLCPGQALYDRLGLIEL